MIDSVTLAELPLALVGGLWLLYLLDYNLSVAVGVGFISLAGVAAETGVVMLLYLDIAYERWMREGKMASWADLAEAVDVPRNYLGKIDREGHQKDHDRATLIADGIAAQLAPCSAVRSSS